MEHMFPIHAPLPPALIQQVDTSGSVGGPVHDSNEDSCKMVEDTEVRPSMSEADKATINPERMKMLQGEHEDEYGLNHGYLPSEAQQKLWSTQYDREAPSFPKGRRSQRRRKIAELRSSEKSSSSTHPVNAGPAGPRARARRCRQPLDTLFCIYCTDTFSTRSITELMWHAKEMDHAIFCIACNKEFFTPKAWRAHLDLIPKEDESHEERIKHFLPCVCGERFGTLALFKVHILAEGHHAVHQKGTTETPMEGVILCGPEATTGTGPDDGYGPRVETSQVGDNKNGNEIGEAPPGPQNRVAIMQQLEERRVWRLALKEKKRVNKIHSRGPSTGLGGVNSAISASTQSHLGPLTGPRAGRIGDNDAKQPQNAMEPLGACMETTTMCKESHISSTPHKSEASFGNLKVGEDSMSVEVSPGIMDPYA